MYTIVKIHQTQHVISVPLTACYFSVIKYGKTEKEVEEEFIGATGCVGTKSQGGTGIGEGFLKAPKYMQHQGDVYTFKGGEEIQRWKVTC